jgi:outer membrane biosynthesis protein TonB
MRVSAWRQAEKLDKIEDGALPDVHLRMDYSRRRLEQQKTDPDTQQQQDKIVKMLNELIKKAEKEEASSSNSNTKNPKDDKKPKQKPQDGKKPSAPKPKPSAGKNNQGGSQPNGKAEVKSYDDSPASPWSRLRDRSRDPANNAVKEKLPARYRDIVERYMEAANGETEK